MKFSDFSPEDQKLLQNRDQLHRACILQIRAAAHLAAVVLLDDKTTGPILAQLDDQEQIGTTTGLIGAVPITAEANKLNIVTLTDFDATWNTGQIRELHSQYVGAINIDGQR